MCTFCAGNSPHFLKKALSYLRPAICKTRHFKIKTASQGLSSFQWYHCIVMDMSPSLWQESYYMISLFMTFTSSLKASQYCLVPLACWLPGNFLWQCSKSQGEDIWMFPWRTPTDSSIGVNPARHHTPDWRKLQKVPKASQFSLPSWGPQTSWLRDKTHTIIPQKPLTWRNYEHNNTATDLCH